MAILANFSAKQKDGSYKNYTISINDLPDTYGRNVVVYESQTKEEREAKAKKTYLGNGYVVWTDGKVTVAEKKAQKQVTNANEDIDQLPF